MLKADRFARLLAVAAAGLLTVAGCGSSNVTSERNSEVPIPAGATVHFLGQASSSGNAIAASASGDTVHRYIQQAIIAQLTAKGYKVVDSNAPATFTVRYYLSAQNVQGGGGQTGGGVGGPAIGGYGSGYGRTTETQLNMPTAEPVKNATFEVDLVDQRMGRTAWRGIISGEPQKGAITAERVNELVAKISKTLPQVP